MVPGMRRYFGIGLLVLAVLGLVAVGGAWVATGAHWGWTATQVKVMRVDPVTELEYPEWEKKLVLGVDFLGAGVAGCVLLGGAGFFALRWGRET